jgi:hypothetical protein
MTIKTRIPPPAAFEPQGDDIRIAIPMLASGFRIYFDTGNLDAIDASRHLC